MGFVRYSVEEDLIIKHKIRLGKKTKSHYSQAKFISFLVDKLDLFVVSSNSQSENLIVNLYFTSKNHS